MGGYGEQLPAQVLAQQNAAAPHYYLPTQLQVAVYRDVINGKAGKTAALSQFLDTYVNPISIKGWGADYAHPLALPQMKFSMTTPLLMQRGIHLSMCI